MVVKRVLQAVVLLFILVSGVIAAPRTERVQDKIKTDEVRANLSLAPLALGGGSELTLVSPKEWNPLAQKLSALIRETHEKYSRLFGTIPAITATVRLMDAEQFYKESGAPRWTNAMYYRNQITIPLTAGEQIDQDNLYRSIKHEYTHAVVNAFSAGRCPGWFDEGLAQWAEGKANPALEPALRKWLVRNPPLPLGMLQGGFTKLDSEMVPPAYAQSLFATRSVLNTFGVEQIRGYFNDLRDGKPKAEAFQDNFRISEKAFEQALGKSLKRWHHSEESSEYKRVAWQR